MARCGADHVNLQPNVRPQRIEDCIPLIDGWRRLADQAGVAVHVETHRDRMTTDLFFTLQLLDWLPDLRLTADVSHYLVGREFAWPVDEVNHALIHRILDNSWGIHGRIASREQVQVSLTHNNKRGGNFFCGVGVIHPLLVAKTPDPRWGGGFHVRGWSLPYPFPGGAGRRSPGERQLAGRKKDRVRGQGKDGEGGETKQQPAPHRVTGVWGSGVVNGGGGLHVAPNSKPG